MKVRELIEYFQTNLYEMSNFFDKDTGLPPGTELWVRAEPNELEHVKYRIKLIHPQRGSAVFAVWGNQTNQLRGNWKVSGRDLKKVQTLIMLTRQEILNHIDGIMSSADLTRAFDRAKPHVEDI